MIHLYNITAISRQVNDRNSRLLSTGESSQNVFTGQLISIIMSNATQSIFIYDLLTPSPALLVRIRDIVGCILDRG